MRLHFTIRDLLLMTVIVALAVGWWLDHRRLVNERAADKAQIASDNAQITSDRAIITKLKLLYEQYMATIAKQAVKLDDLQQDAAK